MASWRPALRMARRDLRRHPLRAAVTALLVALPVTAATTVALVHHNASWDGETAAHQVMGEADALVEVSGFPAVRVRREEGGYQSLRPAVFARERGRRVPLRRDPSRVDLAALLPAGTRTTPAPVYLQRQLAGGGSANIEVADAREPMMRGLASTSAGRTPSGPDEVAVPEAMADELGLLDADGRLRPHARVALAGGRRLHVVGLTGHSVRYGNLTLLVGPASVLVHRPPTSFLVDLPDRMPADLHALAGSLAARGVGMMPRDALFHPRAWRIPAAPQGPVDAKAIAVGALVVLFGLAEVVLLVGSAFAVAARRQVRDLGLLASSGGSPTDVRRVLLAHGLVLGAGASVLGAAVGVALFPTAARVYEAVWEQPVWTRDISWSAVVTLTVLGAVTGLAAALVPAWSLGRLTPVAALSGRFPVRPGESRAHRPAFVLAAAGLLILLLAGLWCAREFAPHPGAGYYQPSMVPVAFGGLGLVLLLAGAVWSAPYAVRVVAALGRALPLSGRYAFRDAARQRFRTAAAAVTLVVTVAAALFAGSVMSSVQAAYAAHRVGPAHSTSVNLDDGSTVSSSERAGRLTTTLRSVLGPVQVHTSSFVVDARDRRRTVTVERRRDDESALTVVDEATLRYLTGGDPAALAGYRAGHVVTTDRRLVRGGRSHAVLRDAHGRAVKRWALPATVTRSGTSAVDVMGDTWVSPSTAAGLGLRPRLESVLVTAGRPITSDDLTRLAVHGIDAWSADVEGAKLDLVRRLLLLGVGVVTLVVAGMAVALSAAEGRADTATLAAVGAGPWRRRGIGGAHGLFLGLVGLLLGVVVGLPAGAALLQVDGLPGVAVPWSTLGDVLVVVPLLAAAAGWLVTPTRLQLVRRAG